MYTHAVTRAAQESERVRHAKSETEKNEMSSCRSASCEWNETRLCGDTIAAAEALTLADAEGQQKKRAEKNTH